MEKVSPFVKITEKTAPELISKLKSGEGKQVLYATLNSSGKPVLNSGATLNSSEAREIVINKISKYVNNLEQAGHMPPQASLIAIV
jgi:hypothetical protein